MAGDVAKPRRLQGANVTEKEVKDVVKFIKTQAEELDMVGGEEDMHVDFDAKGSFGGNTSNPDDSVEEEKYEEARALVIQSQKASASFLQRRLSVGYAKAARLLDILEEKGVVGPGAGAKPREVYIRPDGTVAQEPINFAVATGMNADTPESENDEI